MARAEWCGPQVYEAAGAFVAHCLCADDSLFTPGRQVWRTQTLEALLTRIGDPATAGAGFAERYSNQLEGLPPDVRQVGAELLFAELLAEADTSGATKRSHIERMVAPLGDAVTLPPPLAAALDAGGTASLAAGKAFRAAFLTFLVRTALAARALAPAARAELSTDPWALQELVGRTRSSTDGVMANALLHLTFPETFS